MIVARAPSIGSRMQSTGSQTGAACLKPLALSPAKPALSRAFDKAQPFPIATRLSSIAHAAAVDAEIDEDEVRAQGIRLQMARAMNATVLRVNVPEYKTSPGNWLAIVGSIDELGSWQAQKGARLKWLPGHEWVTDVILPEHYTGSFEYKLVLMNDKGLCVWEPGTNRKLKVSGAFLDTEDHTVDVALQWGLREPEQLTEAEVDFPDSMLEEMYERAERAVKSMPGINAATVLLQAQQQLSQSKRMHREQVTNLREQLVSLQESSKRETTRVQSRMRELERTMEKLQSRLEKERKLSEAHIELLKTHIEERKKTPKPEPGSPAAEEDEVDEEVVAPIRSRRVVRRNTPEVPAPKIGVYETHIMAILPNYSGLSLERLHNMLGQSVFSPRYTRTDSGELAELLSCLVTSNKITADNGIYRYRSRDGSIVGSRRMRSTPRSASKKQSLAIEEEEEHVAAVHAVQQATVTVDPVLLELEPAVMTCLGSTTGMPLDRLASMLHSVAPQTTCDTEQLEALLGHLEVQGKVYNIGGLYRYGKPDARARSPQPSRGLPEAMPHRVTHAPRVHPRTRHYEAPLHAYEAEEPVTRPAYFSTGRVFEGGEYESTAPVGSVPGGPPGSVPGGPPPGVQLTGGSIMPAFDSTGAHPTLDVVDKLEQPVLEILSDYVALSLERLHILMCSSHPSVADCSLEELAAVLKNLTDQHKVKADNGAYAFIAY